MRLFVIESDTVTDKLTASIKEDISKIKSRITLYTRLNETGQVQALKRRMATLNTQLRKLLLSNTCQAAQWQARHVIKTERDGWTFDVLANVPENATRNVHGDIQSYTFEDASTLICEPCAKGGHTITVKR
jgi:hypothetical protein